MWPNRVLWMGFNIAVLGLVYGAFTLGYFQVQAPQPLAKNEVAYVLCIGSFADRCRSAIHVPCYTPPVEWVKAHDPTCKDASATLLADVPGNQCGYAIVYVRCLGA